MADQRHERRIAGLARQLDRPVDGLGAPSLAVWKGDAVAGCVAAASVIAKVTRDRLMTAAHDQWPDYRFDIHKGYCTPLHQRHLDANGPCEIHRWRFENVRRAAALTRSSLSARSI